MSSCRYMRGCFTRNTTYSPCRCFGLEKQSTLHSIKSSRAFHEPKENVHDRFLGSLSMRGRASLATFVQCKFAYTCSSAHAYNIYCMMVGGCDLLLFSWFHILSMAVQPAILFFCGPAISIPPPPPLRLLPHKHRNGFCYTAHWKQSQSRHIITRLGTHSPPARMIPLVLACGSAERICSEPLLSDRRRSLRVARSCRIFRQVCINGNYYVP